MWDAQFSDTCTLSPTHRLRDKMKLYAESHSPTYTSYGFIVDSYDSDDMFRDRVSKAA